MTEPPPLVRALFALSVYDEPTHTLEDTRTVGAAVTVAPSYQPFDPTGQRTHGSLQIRCTATRETADRLDLPTAVLAVDAIERRVWEEPTVSVYDPRTEPVGEDATRIVEPRWRALGVLIGFDE